MNLLFITSFPNRRVFRVPDSQIKLTKCLRLTSKKGSPLNWLKIAVTVYNRESEYSEPEIASHETKIKSFLNTLNAADCKTE